MRTTVVARDDFPGLLEPGGDVPYLVVSHAGRPRWAFPMSDPKVLAASMTVHTPTTAHAVAAWHAAVVAARAGFGSLLPGRHRRFRARLAPSLAKVVGIDPIHVSVAESFHGGRWVLGMLDGSGVVHGYAKLASTADPVSVSRLRGEAETLTRLQGRLGGLAVPKVLHLGPLEDFEALVITPVVGRPGFDPAMLTKRRVDAAVRIFSIRGPATTIADHLDVSIDDAAWRGRIDAVRAITEGVSDIPLPSGLVHGDFAAWNLIDDGRRVGVIDWDEARFEGLPFWDLWHFAVLGAVTIGNERMRRRIHLAVRGEGMLAESIQAYAEASGVPAGIAPDVLLLYLVQHGIAVRQRAEAGASDARRGLVRWERLLDELIETLR